jgi:NAD(P)-dependent dehydrogenase (short-subunit alcohol dehydrogenase family)
MIHNIEDFYRRLFNLENKVAIVTGGAGVLAGEISAGLSKAGAKIILLDINGNELDRKVAELRQINSQIFGYKCNVLDPEDLNSVNKLILGNHKKIDILLNMAGGNMSSATLEENESIFDINIENLRKVVDLNLFGTVLPTLIFGRQMTKQQNGSIINISSMASFKAISRVAGYSAAKAAVDNFTRWMAMELATKFGSGLRVNSIAPGFLITNQNRNLLLKPDGSFTKRARQIINITPFKRFGVPDELIGAVLWLAGDAAKFVTGTVIPIDGGFSINSGV